MSHLRSTVGGIVVSIALALTLTGCLSAPEADVKETIRVTEAVSPSAPAAASDDSTFSMPNYRDWVLQDAQDNLQSLGSYLMNQEDASGDGRLQVNDSNWHVCSQKPVAGVRVNPADIITLWVVKLDEVCP